jgi:transposase InsO family protein
VRWSSARTQRCRYHSSVGCWRYRALRSTGHPARAVIRPGEIVPVINAMIVRSSAPTSAGRHGWRPKRHLVNRKRVQRLMRLMGLVAIYQRPNTSKAAAAHKIYPYLLGGIVIERVNQVWCSDFTYIPMAKGFLYLVVVMDWVSRAVLAWRPSNTLGADFVSRRSRRRSPDTAGPRSSIPTRAVSSPATISPAR